MPSIPVNSALGYIGVFLVLFGFFLILAGLDIFKIERITVKPGVKTWAFGVILAIFGLAFLLPDILGSFSQSSRLAPSAMAASPTSTLTPIPSTNTPSSSIPQATNTKIPTPQLTPTVPSDVGMIILQGSYNLVGLNTQVQWLDGLDHWRNVENWHGQLDSTGRISWLVWPKDFNTGPFRWMVYYRDGSIRFESQSFDLPGAGQPYLIRID